MAAGKRRPERLRDRVQVGPDAIEKLLDSVRQEVLADDDEQQERHDPPTRPAQGLGDGEDDGERDHHLRVSEMRDPAEPPFRHRASVVGTPLRDARVDVDELRVGPHEIGEPGQDQTAQEREREGDRQREAGRNLGVEPALDRPAKPAVVPYLTSDGFGGGNGRRGSRHFRVRDSATRGTPTMETRRRAR